MKFSLPIENSKADVLYAQAYNDAGGYYPIGSDNLYHGGIHVAEKHPVIAIADGTIVAYRYSKKYCIEKIEKKEYRYSDCFILIRHEFTSPKKQKFVFYSHYNNLCPWDEYDNEEKKRRPIPFVKAKFKINHDTDLYSDTTENEQKKIQNVILEKGTTVEAEIIDEVWAKKNGVKQFFKMKKAKKISESYDGMTYDSIVTNVAEPILVRAGNLLGYTGLFESKKKTGKYMVHIEVFAGSDAKQFLDNTTKDVGTFFTHFNLEPSTPLKKKGEKKFKIESKCPVLHFQNHVFVEIISRDPHQNWVKVKETDRVATAEIADFDLHPDAANKDNDYYTVKKGSLQKIQKLFNASEITDQTKIKRTALGKDRDKKIKDKKKNKYFEYAVPPDNAASVWVNKAKIDSIWDYRLLYEDLKEGYSENPAVLVFKESAEPSADSVLIRDSENVVRGMDENGKLWFYFKNDQIDGWVQAEDKKLVRLTAFDWPGFSIETETESKKVETCNDLIVDYENLSLFFKGIIDKVKKEDDNFISTANLKILRKNPKLNHLFSRTICFHQSEWWLGKDMEGWKRILIKIGEGPADRLKEKLSKVCWWDEVSSKLGRQFLNSPKVYTWHPIAFVEQMREIEKDPDWISIARKEIGVREKPGQGGANAEPRIIEYFNSIPYPTTSDDTAWCAAFVNWSFTQCGITTGIKDAGAKSWEAWGEKYKEPVYGAVAVIRYTYDDSTDENKSGHVGFVVGKNGKKIIMLGGNQGDMVQLKSYNPNSIHSTDKEGNKMTGKVVAYVLPSHWPPDYAVPFCDTTDIDEIAGTR